MQKAWWSVGEMAIGPFGTRACFSGECAERGLSWIIGAESLWMRSAVAARAAGYIAMFVLLALAGALAAKRIPHLVAKLTFVTLLTAGVTGGYFALAFPGVPSSSVDIGLFLFIAALVLGAVAPVIVVRSAAAAPPKRR